MPLQRRRAMKCGESWMGKRTINSILTLNRICIILICSISVLYNSVTQGHRMGNKMGDHESIPPLSMMVDLSWLFSNLLLLLSPFLPPPPTFCHLAFVLVSFLSHLLVEKKKKNTTTRFLWQIQSPYFGFSHLLTSWKHFICSPRFWRYNRELIVVDAAFNLLFHQMDMILLWA